MNGLPSVGEVGEPLRAVGATVHGVDKKQINRKKPKSLSLVVRTEMASAQASKLQDVTLHSPDRIRYCMVHERHFPALKSWFPFSSWNKYSWANHLEETKQPGVCVCVWGRGGAL